jgi:hypothetical protein
MEILKEIKDLHLVDHNFEGIINLPFWADYTLPDTKPNEGNIRICFGQDFEKDYEINTSDANGYACVSSWAEEHKQQILQKLFEEYPKWQPDYGYSPEESKMFMPDIASIDDFKHLIQLCNVHILPIALDGTAYIGYEFNCQWDVEHGMGAMFHAKRMVDFGMAESSFVIWKAQQDIDAHTPKEPTEIIFDKIKLQQGLYQFTVNSLKERVAEFPEIKNIYALAYDYDLIYNKVHLSMNTLVGFEADLTEAKKNYPTITEKHIHEIKYNPGNYKHCAFDTFIPLSQEEHTQIEKWMNASDIESAKKWQDNFGELREAFAEILAIYSKGEEVKLLPITNDLKVLSIEINGDLAEAEERINKYL